MIKVSAYLYMLITRIEKQADLDFGDTFSILDRRLGQRVAKAYRASFIASWLRKEEKISLICLIITVAIDLFLRKNSIANILLF